MVTPNPYGDSSAASASAHRSAAALDAEYTEAKGIPRIAPVLDTTTMRPSPADRMPGSNALVKAAGPKRFVPNNRLHAVAGVSSPNPAAATPALWTSPYGGPTTSRISAAAAETDLGSTRSNATPTRRGSPAVDPVTARMALSPTS